MNRTLLAVLRYTRPDLKWAVLGTAALGVFCEGLGIFVTVMGESEAVSLLILALLLGFGFLMNLICAVVYLFTNFPMLLAFSATRRGLTAGLAAHCLLFTALQVGTAFVWGTVSTLVRGWLLGTPPDLLWQWMPWPVWPALLLFPTLLGLFFGGMVQRFGPRAGWVLYALFLLIFGTSSSWLPLFTDHMPAAGYLPLALGGAILALALGLLGVRFLQRSSVS